MDSQNKYFKWVYFLGFAVILALPILVVPPYFAPPDWGKTIVFRSVLAILLFLFLWQILYRKNEISMPNIKNNKIIWALIGLFIIFLLATIFSVDPYFSLWGSPWRGGGFVTFAFYFVFAVLAFILFKKDAWKKAWDLSIVIGILVSSVAVIQYYGLFNKIFLPVAGRPPSTMGNTIILAIYLLLLFFITLSFALKEPFDSTQGKIKKIFYCFIVLLFIYVILISGSRAAYIGLLIGGIFFILFYPKKLLILKIAMVIFLILGAFAVYYVNSNVNFPKFLENNRIFKSIQPRLSFQSVLNDPRFYAWAGIDYKILIEKPILGYGPENFSVGFDKYYDPSIPYLNLSWGDWWDKAHNILLDIGAQAGVPAIIIYLALFAVLFWQLQKLKNPHKSEEIRINQCPVAHGIQASLIGYLVANFFSFDTFGTYIIFFLIIGYSLYLISSNNNKINENQLSSANILTRHCERIRSNLIKLFNRLLRLMPRNDEREIKYKKAIIVISFILLVLFLWQYNFVPFLINAEINKADDLANRKYCGQALSLMDKILPKHSFLDSYARMKYVGFTKICNDYFPENNLTYITKGLELIKEAVKIQPLYTRYWIFLGSSTAAIAAQEKNAETKNNLLKQASDYFDKALQLSPKRQEIPIEQAKMEIVASDYKKMRDYSEKCIALNPGLGACYWYLALSEIYSKNISDAKKDIQKTIGYNTASKTSLGELSDAYGFIKDYQDLITVYEKLIVLNPDVAQYHSSLAFFYKELGQYSKARQEAMIVLKLSPESKPNIDAFLKTLP